EVKGEGVTRSQDDRAGVPLGKPGRGGGRGQIAQHVVHHAGDGHGVGAGRTRIGDSEAVGDGVPLSDGRRPGLVHRDTRVGGGHRQRGGVRGVVRLLFFVVARRRDGVVHSAATRRCSRGEVEGERVTRGQDDRAGVPLGQPGGAGGGGQIAQHVVHHAGD